MEIIKERDAALIGYNECRATIEDARIALKAHAHEGLLLAALRIQEELVSERALADRLAEALKGIWPFIEEDTPHGCNSTAYMNAIELCRANITEWKEARSECR